MPGLVEGGDVEPIPFPDKSRDRTVLGRDLPDGSQRDSQEVREKHRDRSAVRDDDDRSISMRGDRLESREKAIAKRRERFDAPAGGLAGIPPPPRERGAVRRRKIRKKPPLPGTQGDLAEGGSSRHGRAQTAGDDFGRLRRARKIRGPDAGRTKTPPQLRARAPRLRAASCREGRSGALDANLGAVLGLPVADEKDLHTYKTRRRKRAR